MTNTNWQGYGGQSTMSYFTQMAALTVQNFLSAATGMAVAVAPIRGFGRQKVDTVANFRVDTTRSTLYTRCACARLPLSVDSRALSLPTSAALRGYSRRASRD